MRPTGSHMLPGCGLPLWLWAFYKMNSLQSFRSLFLLYDMHITWITSHRENVSLLGELCHSLPTPSSHTVAFSLWEEAQGSISLRRAECRHLFFVVPADGWIDRWMNDGWMIDGEQMDKWMDGWWMDVEWVGRWTTAVERTWTYLPVCLDITHHLHPESGQPPPGSEGPSCQSSTSVWGPPSVWCWGCGWNGRL